MTSIPALSRFVAGCHIKTAIVALLALIAMLPCLAGDVKYQDPQLVILSATYGIKDHRVDMTEVMRSLQSHGVILLRAPWALCPEDPAPNQVKDVDILYTINGVKKEIVFNQNQNIILTAVPRRLVIVSGRYGLADRRVDVTEVLRSGVAEDGTLRIKSFWALGRVDPAAGSVKDVEIVYIDFGIPKVTFFKQDQDIILPKKE